jgi:hypothetical protein
MMIKMKLSKEQKTYRKELKKNLSSRGGFFLRQNNDTYLFCPVFPNSNTWQMSCAICHPKDQYSRKYGEFIALDNWIVGHYIKVSHNFVDNMTENLRHKYSYF